MQTVNGQTAISQTGVQNGIANPNETFYADGLQAVTGLADGGVVFSNSAVWSASLVDPLSLGSGTTSDSLSTMAGDDDMPISGLQFISSSSPYFPRLR